LHHQCQWQSEFAYVCISLQRSCKILFSGLHLAIFEAMGPRKASLYSDIPVYSFFRTNTIAPMSIFLCGTWCEDFWQDWLQVFVWLSKRGLEHCVTWEADGSCHRHALSFTELHARTMPFFFVIIFTLIIAYENWWLSVRCAIITLRSLYCGRNVGNMNHDEFFEASLIRVCESMHIKGAQEMKNDWLIHSIGDRKLRLLSSPHDEKRLYRTILMFVDILSHTSKVAYALRND
jgi:hypothetical protein